MTGGIARTGDSGWLAVDWQRCEGRGLCAQLLPERIGLDEWGYPVVNGPLRPGDAGHTRAAVLACPHAALRVVRS